MDMLIGILGGLASLFAIVAGIYALARWIRSHSAQARSSGPRPPARPAGSALADALRATAELGRILVDSVFQDLRDKVATVGASWSPEEMKAEIMKILETTRDDIAKKASHEFLEPAETDPPEVRTIKTGTSLGWSIASGQIEGVIKSFEQLSHGRHDYRDLILEVIDGSQEQLATQVKALPT